MLFRKALADKSKVVPAVLLVIVLHGVGAMLACGGGTSSASNPPANNPPTTSTGDFSLAVESPTVTVQQAGALQVQSIQATSVNGFTGTVQVTLTGLPPGVSLAPSGPYSISLANGEQGVSAQLAASASAQTGTSTITVTGTSGSISHSITFSLGVKTAAPFSINVSPGSVSLTPGSSATLTVTVQSNSPPPQLAVTLPDGSSLPGLNFLEPQGFLTPTNPLTFGIEATILAQSVQNYPYIITASDNNNNSAIFVLPLTIAVPFSSSSNATRSTFASTGQPPTGMVYDEARKLLFVTVEPLNEVLVLSSVDGHQVASIPVQSPTGIDESADGTAVYVVSPYFTTVITIDPNLLQVVGEASVPASVYGSYASPGFFQVAALSNGQVFLEMPQSITGNESLKPFYLWDPATNSYTSLPQAVSSVGWGILRSADRTKVLAVVGGNATIYDAATGTFSATGPDIGGYWAINLNGSQIISVGGQNSPTVFFDGNFNQIATMQLDAFPVSGVLYSWDGSEVYVFVAQNNLIENIASVIDTSSFTVAGLVPGFTFGSSLPFSGEVVTSFATDETNMLFGSTNGGVGFLDMTSPTSLALPLPGPFQVQPTLASLSSPTQSQVSGAGFSQDFGFNLFLGAAPASSQSIMAGNVSFQSINILNATIPKGSTPGAVNATLTRSDGFFEVMPDAVSFGPSVLAIDANGGSPAGGDTIQIYGHGFVSTQDTQVTIGGKAAASSTSSTVMLSNTAVPYETMTVQTPAGTSGSADVTLSNSGGTVTVSGGFQYLNSVAVYPKTGALDDLVYDQTRQRVYISNQNYNEVEVFDLGSSTFLAPVKVGNNPTAIALTPDAALFAVVNSNDNTISVVNPSNFQVVGTYPDMTSNDLNEVCQGVVYGMVPAAPHRVLDSVYCNSTEGGAGIFHLINLDTGVLSCAGVPTCASNGTDIPFGTAATASTADGTEIFLASTTLNGAPVALLNLSANTMITGPSNSYSDAAASADGTVFAASFGTFNSQLSQLGVMAWEPYGSSGVASLNNLVGEKLNPSGSLLFVPQTSGVDIFDVHTGQLALHVALQDGIPSDTNSMVLDETGTKMFLISNSGLTIAQLYQAPLSLANTNPASGAPGASVTLSGSGFVTGATVTFGTVQAASATFVDSNTLEVTVPSLAAGSVRITITNPSGSQYSFDDAFLVN